MSQRIVLSLILSVLMVLSGYGPAWAQETQESGRGQFSTANLLVGDMVQRGDGSVVRELGIEIILDDGWKTYWRSPGDAGFPLTVDAAGSENIGAVTLHWPYPRRFVEEWGLEVFGYKERLVLPVSVEVVDYTQPVQLAFKTNYAVCSDICIAEDIVFNVEIPREKAPSAEVEKKLRSAWAQVPVGNGDAGFAVISAYIENEDPEKNTGIFFVRLRSYGEAFKDPELFIEGPAGIRFPRAKVEAEKGGEMLAMRVPYEIALPAKTLYSEEIHLTVTHQGKAIELSWDTTPPYPYEDDEEYDGMEGHHDAAVAPAGDGGAGAGDGGIGHVGTGTSSASVPPLNLSFGLVLLMALLGGLILNVMPCVLPVLSLKLLSVAKHGGGDRAEVRRSFLATTLGIMLSFAILAGLTASAREAGMAVGWGFHFQSSAFLSFLALLVLLFALNLLGVFEVALPQWLNTHIYDRVGRKKVHRSHFTGDVAMGALAALMATPCTAPFLGTAVGYALSRGGAEIWAVFLALGAGLSLPYLAAALMPSLVVKLPKPGPWMVRVKHFMGLLMLLAAVWLFWVLGQQVGFSLAVTAATLGAIAGFLLRHRGASEGRRRLALGLAAMAILLASLLLPRLLGYSTPMPRMTELVAADELHWYEFDESQIPVHVAAGRVVFVDITADWCLTCKANKLFVLNAPQVRSALAADDIVLFKGDMTVSVPELEDYLRKHGRYGIPFNAVYGAGTEEGPILLPELLNRDVVLQALDRARGGKS